MILFFKLISSNQSCRHQGIGENILSYTVFFTRLSSHCEPYSTINPPPYNIMITVTLGTIPYPFERVISWLDLLLDREIIKDEVFLQHGVTDVSLLCRHKLVTSEPLLPAEKLAKKMHDSELIISHAGQGSTRKLSVQGKSFVIIPRLAEYGEHIDNHQLLFSQGVNNLGVTVCATIEELQQAIQNPPKPLQRDLFSGPKLGDYLAEKYPQERVYRREKSLVKR